MEETMTELKHRQQPVNNVNVFLGIPAGTKGRELELARREAWGPIYARGSFYQEREANTGQRKARQLVIAWVLEEIRKAAGNGQLPAVGSGWKNDGKLEVSLRADYKVQVVVAWGYSGHQKKVFVERNVTGLPFGEIAEQGAEAVRFVRERVQAEDDKKMNTAIGAGAVAELAEIVTPSWIVKHPSRDGYASGTFWIGSRQVQLEIRGDHPEELRVKVEGLNRETAEILLSRILVNAD